MDISDYPMGEGGILRGDMETWSSAKEFGVIARVGQYGAVEGQEGRGLDSLDEAEY